MLANYDFAPHPHKLVKTLGRFPRLGKQYNSIQLTNNNTLLLWKLFDFDQPHSTLNKSKSRMSAQKRNENRFKYEEMSLRKAWEDWYCLQADIKKIYSGKT